jgi:TIR domain/Pentapeptide repeats (8 copies)
MTNQKQVALLKQGWTTWYAWRHANPDITPDLNGADLATADLRRVNLSYADLRGANLTASDLRRATLIGANLSGAILTGANLIGANLSGADLSTALLGQTNFFRANLGDANLSDAKLTRANLSDASLNRANLRGAYFGEANLRNADLREADLSEVRMYGIVFANVDLSVTRGLETIIHTGPSTIGIDTLFKSNGKIPKVFLREAGVPEDFITEIPSLIAGIQPIQFHSCFISYSHQDEQFSRRLHSRMRAEKLRVWYAPEDMKGGRKLHEEIFSAIQIHDKLLLVLSESSMKSEWVMTEIRRARKVEREESRRKLFPIRLVDFETIKNWECFDGYSGKDLAVELREYYIPNFSNWKDHDAFEAEFSKLLRDLRATET